MSLEDEELDFDETEDYVNDLLYDTNDNKSTEVTHQDSSDESNDGNQNSKQSDEDIDEDSKDESSQESEEEVEEGNEETNQNTNYESEAEEVDNRSDEELNKESEEGEINEDSNEVSEEIIYVADKQSEVQTNPLTDKTVGNSNKSAEEEINDSLMTDDEDSEDCQPIVVNKKDKQKTTEDKNQNTSESLRKLNEKSLDSREDPKETTNRTNNLKESFDSFKDKKSKNSDNNKGIESSHSSDPQNSDFDMFEDLEKALFMIHSDESSLKDSVHQLNKSQPKDITKKSVSADKTVTKLVNNSVKNHENSSLTKSTKSSVTESVKTATKDQIKTPIAKTSAKKSIKTSVIDSVKTPAKDLAKTPTVETSVRKAAKSSLIDSVKTPAKDLVKTQTVETSVRKATKSSAIDSVKTSAKDLMSTQTDKTVKKGVKSSKSDSGETSTINSETNSLKKSEKSSTTDSVKKLATNRENISIPKSTKSSAIDSVKTPAKELAKTPTVKTAANKVVKSSMSDSTQISAIINSVTNSRKNYGNSSTTDSIKTSAITSAINSESYSTNSTQSSLISLTQNSVINSVNNLSVPTTSGLRKTLDLDKKYYDSMRIYLTQGKIIGYPEETFTQEAKHFKLKKGVLYCNSKEVIEIVEQQREIAMTYHLNASAKSAKSRHRGAAATKRAIETKYFWGGIQLDIENAINNCRVCNPKDHDMTSYQMWKYIEIGSIEKVLVVRDLNEKSSLFNCAFLEDMSALNLCQHLMDLFRTYGTPNAIRIVLDYVLNKPFIKQMAEYLRKEFQKIKEELEFVAQHSPENKFKLPTLDIRIEFDSTNCPKNENELEMNANAVIVDEDITLFHIFSCNHWLITDSVFNTISADIKSYVKNFSDWKSRLSSLTLFFQINGINLKANEVEEEEEDETVTQESTTKSKRGALRELERLQTDFKTGKPSFRPFLPEKEDTKKKEKEKSSSKRSDSINKKSKYSVESSDSSSDWSDDNTSVVSKHSNSKKESKVKKNLKNSFKEVPFKQILRESEEERVNRTSVDSIEVINLDDDSQQSVLSQRSSLISLSSESKSCEPPVLQTNDSNSDTKTDIEKYDPNNLCQDCEVRLYLFSPQDIEKAIEGLYDLNQGVSNIAPNIPSSQSVVESQEIMFSEDSEDENQTQDSNEETINPNEKQEKSLVKDVISEELKKRGSVERQPSKEVELNLSESSSEDEESIVPTAKPKEAPVVRSTPVVQTKPKPSVSQTPTTVPTVRISKTSLNSQTCVTPRSQPTRKRKANNSDNDSDFDIRKEESSLTGNKKRPKSDSMPKTSANSQSNKKRKEKRISKRIIASDSSESEDNEEQREDLKTQSDKKRPKQNNVTNSETTSAGGGGGATPGGGGQVINCDFCDFTTNERRVFIMHSTKHKNERKNAILCPNCSKQFFNKDSLERHKEEEHPPEYHNAILYGCEKCKDFSCFSSHELEKHLFESHIEDLTYMKTSSKHRCEICNGFTAPNKEVMFTHMKQKHLMFKCVFDCHFVSLDFQALKRHAKSQHSRLGHPYDCRYCEFTTPVFGDLVQHRQTTHSIDWTADQMKNKCVLCDDYFEYDDTNAILEHLSSHSTDFSYFECKSCHKRCRQMEQLKKHCETHHAVGPAEGLEAHIANLSQLFEELRQQLVNSQSNKAKKSQSNPTETQNALLGLMDDQFDDDDNTQSQNATAWDYALNGEEEGDGGPTISIPENGDDFGIIEEDEEGNWAPV